VGIFYRRSTQGWAGRHRVILVAGYRGHKAHLERELQVLPSLHSYHRWSLGGNCALERGRRQALERGYP
jgi:hypothetical protein